MVKQASVLIPIIAALGLAACSEVGPNALRSTRPEYNLAVQQTNDQELLLNLLRMRYRDSLYFTSVERIQVARELNQSFGVGGSVSATNQEPAASVPLASSSAVVKDIFQRTLTAVGPTVAVNERPTIFYTPVEGEKFVRQMMAPMRLDVLLLEADAGWTIGRIFAVCVQRINGYRNSVLTLAAQPGVSDAVIAEAKKFREILSLLDRLQTAGALSFVRVQAGESANGTAAGAVSVAEKEDESLEIRFTPRTTQEEADVSTLKTSLGLVDDPKNPNTFRLIAAPQPPNRHTIAIATRSLIYTMYYLGHGIVVPQRDLDAGRTDATAMEESPNETAWPHRILKVHSSATTPSDASVAIYYRDSWYYIADGDIESKSTFVLLTQLISLHSVQSTAPAAALAIGGR
jgi:hypothetical protein